MAPLPGRAHWRLSRAGTASCFDDVRIFRDIYYTAALAFTSRRPFGVDEPYPLGPDEFFVLGDNSPVSNDSAVLARESRRSRRDVPGKPSSCTCPVAAERAQAVRRLLYWVPDPGEIRYIR
ncbi:MAG: hypothetical protein U0794_13310 [Isosphaeraceae bacterium]